MITTLIDAFAVGFFVGSFISIFLWFSISLVVLEKR